MAAKAGLDAAHRGFDDVVSVEDADQPWRRRAGAHRVSFSAMALHEAAGDADDMTCSPRRCPAAMASSDRPGRFHIAGASGGSRRRLTTASALSPSAALNHRRKVGGDRRRYRPRRRPSTLLEFGRDLGAPGTKGNSSIGYPRRVGSLRGRLEAGAERENNASAGLRRPGPACGPPAVRPKPLLNEEIP